MNQTINYNNSKLRIIGSFLAAVYIVLHGKFAHFAKALRSPAFYSVLAFSFGLALLLVYIIHRVTRKLDQKADWKTHTLKRVRYQCGLGVAFPIILDLIFIYIFSLITNRDIFGRGYLTSDFVVVVGLVVCFNIYYLFHYQYLTGAFQIKEPIQEGLPTHEESSISDNTISQKAEKTHLAVHSGARVIYLHVASEVAFFYRQNSVNWVQTYSGSRYLITESLNEINDMFGGKDLFMISRTAIVSSNIISGFVTGQSRTLKLQIKPEYRVLDEEFFSVSQKKSPNFENGWPDSIG